MPLFPRRVSFVDSGNLLACLLALAQALGEVPDARARALAERARTLADGMRLSPLYDPARKLFRIGFDAERGQFDENCYDLLESEARLASYVAVSRGEAGIEQINRRVLEKVTHLVCVSDQSRKGLSIIKTIKEVSDRLVMYDEIGLIVNRAPMPDRIPESEELGVPVLSVIPQDNGMTENDIEGRSIFELPADSPILKGAEDALYKMHIL